MRRTCLAATLVALAVLAGCPGPAGSAGGGSGGSGEARTALTVQLNWLPQPQFGGFYAAELTGAFAKRGLDVTIRKGGPDVPAVQMTAAGQVELGLAAADEVVRIREGGADIVALFATYQTAPQGLMTHAARGFDSLEALLRGEGKLAVQPGLAYVEHLRRRYGMEKLELVTYQGGIGPFLADPMLSQQCFVTEEPLTAKRQGADPRTFLIADSGFNPYTSVVITRRDYLEQHRDAVTAFVAALREGWRAYLDDPAPTNARLHELEPSMDLETLAGAAAAQVPLIETEETKARGLGCMTRERWAELVRQLTELGVVKTAPAPESCFEDLSVVQVLPVGDPTPVGGDAPR